MGNDIVTNKDGKVTTVDKAWTYTKDDAVNLRILVHHSSLPYTGKKLVTDKLLSHPNLSELIARLRSHIINVEVNNES
jgi:hypothetical protein